MVTETHCRRAFVARAVMPRLRELFAVQEFLTESPIQLWNQGRLGTQFYSAWAGRLKGARLPVRLPT